MKVLEEEDLSLLLCFKACLVTTRGIVYVSMIEDGLSQPNDSTEETLSTMSAENLGEHLYNSYYTPLFRYLYFRVRNHDDAEDLAQTVFVKAFNSLKEGMWNGAGGIKYLFTIARNTLIDHYRRAKHVAIASDELIESFADLVATDGPVEERERRELIASGLKVLRDTEAEAVNLRYIADMDYDAIAVIMGKRPDAVRQLVHRGLKTLRKFLEEGGLLD